MARFCETDSFVECKRVIHVAKMSDYVMVFKKLQNFEVLLQYLLWRWLDLKIVNFQLSSWVTGTVFSHRQYTADD